MRILSIHTVPVTLAKATREKLREKRFLSRKKIVNRDDFTCFRSGCVGVWVEGWKVAAEIAFSPREKGKFVNKYLFRF